MDGLRLHERPEPRPGPGELLLGLRATALNSRDLMIVEGRYDPRLRLPTVPGSDAVWTVLECGPAVVGYAPGDRVITLFSPGWGGGPPTRALVRDALGGWRSGVWSERYIATPSEVVPAPASLTDEQAATLPCAGLTAWSALISLGGLCPGQTVVATGSGGVAIFAVQIARQAGARVALVSGSPDKAARLTELGAEAILDRRSPWAKAARQWAGGEGVDHVLDLGGAGSISQSIDAIRPGGVVSVIGVLGGAVEPIDVRPILMKQARVQGVFVGDRTGLLALCTAASAGIWRPAIHKRHGFEDIPAALADLADGQHVGKIVVTAP